MFGRNARRTRAPATGLDCAFLMGVKNGTWTLPIGTKSFCVK
ncbi:MAG: hypothetical protein WBW80_18790 [Acidimicrobiales bacterium]